MIKKIIFFVIITLTGCNDNAEVFGIKIGGDVQSLRDKNIVEHEEAIPSKGVFLIIDLKKPPKSDVGDKAKYSASSLNGTIIGASAKIIDPSGDYYESMLSYAKSKLGDPIANDGEVKNQQQINFSPYGCIQANSCPTQKFTAFRKGSINALVTSGDGKTTIDFDSDLVKDALKQR